MAEPSGPNRPSTREELPAEQAAQGVAARRLYEGRRGATQRKLTAESTPGLTGAPDAAVSDSEPSAAAEERAPEPLTPLEATKRLADLALPDITAELVNVLGAETKVAVPAVQAFDYLTSPSAELNEQPSVLAKLRVYDELGSLGSCSVMLTEVAASTIAALHIGEDAQNPEPGFPKKYHDKVLNLLLSIATSVARSSHNNVIQPPQAELVEAGYRADFGTSSGGAYREGTPSTGTVIRYRVEHPLLASRPSKGMNLYVFLDSSAGVAVAEQLTTKDELLVYQKTLAETLPTVTQQQAGLLHWAEEFPKLSDLAGPDRIAAAAEPEQALQTAASELGTIQLVEWYFRIAANTIKIRLRQADTSTAPDMEMRERWAALGTNIETLYDNRFFGGRSLADQPAATRWYGDDTVDALTTRLSDWVETYVRARQTLLLALEPAIEEADRAESPKEWLVRKLGTYLREHYADGFNGIAKKLFEEDRFGGDSPLTYAETTHYERVLDHPLNQQQRTRLMQNLWDSESSENNQSARTELSDLAAEYDGMDETHKQMTRDEFVTEAREAYREIQDDLALVRSDAVRLGIELDEVANEAETSND